MTCETNHPGDDPAAEGVGPSLTPTGPRRVFYGRLRGKTLKPNQVRVLRDLLPHLAVPGVGRPGDDGRAPVDPAALFGDDRPVWLEIGFGGGEHLAALAATHPDVGVIGAEPFVNGVAKALTRIEAAGVGNVRIHAGDARDLLDLLPEAGVARVYLLYPDPWHKSRHRERRFMNADNLAALARIMPVGAELRLATDIEDYVRHALREAGDAPGFDVTGGPEDWRAPWPGWRTTRYEAKALREGRVPHYLVFRRV